MRHFLSVLRKSFPQNGFLLTMLSMVAAGGLFLVFWKEWSEHPLASVVYTFSAYVLVAVILWLIPRVPVWCERVRQIPAVARWRADPMLRKRVSLYRPLYVGLLFVAYNAIAGIYYRSVWFTAMAVYYAVLSLQRGLILRAELGMSKRLRHDTVSIACGWLMLLLSMLIFGIRLLLFLDGERIVYPGHMIYAVALYAFCSLTTAMVHTVRRGSDMMPTDYRRVQLVAALVSILFLQAALLAAFAEDLRVASYANLAAGSVLALFTLGLGGRMIVFHSGRMNGNCELKEKTAENI